jgi:hypothetical protein
MPVPVIVPLAQRACVSIGSGLGAERTAPAAELVGVGS